MIKNLILSDDILPDYFVISRLVNPRTMKISLLRQFVLISLCWLTGLCFVNASGRPVANIPFEISGSYIVINLKINNSTPLNLILDTGVRNTIITELQPDDSLSVSVSRKQSVLGLGQGQDAQAMVSDFNTISLGKLHLRNKSVFILEKDIFGLSQHNGRKINGLAGLDILKDYVVLVDYTNRRLKFYDPNTFVPPAKFGSRPILMENNKVYIQLNLLDPDAKIRMIKMLLDTGAQLTAWFQTVKTNSTPIPEKRVHARIGEGFSGEIFGYLARIPMICLDQFCFKNPIVVFPDSATINEVIRRSDRDGTIGSELLSRFDYYLDFRNNKIYFRPNYLFKSDFRYNIAGIEIMQTMYPFPRFEVTHVWKDSPAEKAGIIPGDILLEINSLKTFGYALNEIREIFRTRSKSHLRMLIQRDDRELVVEVDMTDKLRLPG